MTSKTVAAGAAFAVAAATLIAAPTAADAAGRGTTHVKVTSKHTVAAPASLRPGVVHLRNDGKAPVLVFRKKKDGAVKLVKYLASEKASVERKIFTRFGFVDFLTAKGDDFVRLSKGTYYFVAAVGSKPKLKGVRTVMVTGRRVDAVRPAHRNLQISSKGVVSGASTAAPRGYLRLRNASSSFRLVTALVVKPSATAADLRAALADKTGEKLNDVLDFEHYVGPLAYLGGKQDLTTRTTLERGRYLLASVAMSGSSMSMPAYHLLTVR